jgi:hypothetical protein
MTQDEAQNLVKDLAEKGFQAAIGWEQWPDGWVNWFIMVETRQGHIFHLITPEAVAHFIEHDGPPEFAEPSKAMQRYLRCQVCGARFSANPEHYVGWAGWLSHCGKALQMWQRNPIDGAEYMVSELVDHEYLRKPHADEYALHSPLHRHDSQLYYGIAKEETPGTPVKPPRIPDALREPEWKPDPGLIGLALYEAGYLRDPDGVWRRTFRLMMVAAEDYHPFEEGDRIEYEDEHTIPFTALQTHRSPNYWGIRFAA